MNPSPEPRRANCRLRARVSNSLCLQAYAVLLCASAQAACDRASTRSVETPEAHAPASIVSADPRIHAIAGESASAATPATASSVARDSGGIRIIEPLAPVWQETERWRVDSSYVQIGVVDGDSTYEFSYIDDGAIGSDGTVALADRAREIRIFTSTGRHVKTFGRPGDGPGEFRRAGTAPEMALAFASSDRLVVADGRRIAWFSVEGAFLHEADLRRAIRDPRQAASSEWRVASDGSVLLLGSIPIGKWAGDHWVYLATAEDDGFVVTRIAEFQVQPSVRIAGSSGLPNTGVSRPFEPRAPAATAMIHPLRVVVAHPTRWEVRVHRADGSMESIIRLPIERTPVTPSLIAAAREDLRSRSRNEPRLAAILKAYDNFIHVDSMPAISRVYWDPDGYIWLEHYVPHLLSFANVERRFEVLRDNGEWLGRIALPMGVLHVWQISAGRILTKYAAPDDVDIARIYMLRMR